MFNMKSFLLAVAVICSFSVYSQSIEQKLKAAIEKIESSDSVIQGEKITNLNVIIEKYAVISIKDWWKIFYDSDVEFNNGMNNLFLMIQHEDSIKGTHVADSFAANQEEKQQKNTLNSNNPDYFKNKYETADTSVKVYKILYHTEFNLGTIRSGRDSHNIALYVKDLSKVK